MQSGRAGAWCRRAGSSGGADWAARRRNLEADPAVWVGVRACEVACSVHRLQTSGEGRRRVGSARDRIREGEGCALHGVFLPDDVRQLRAARERGREQGGGQEQGPEQGRQPAAAALGPGGRRESGAPALGGDEGSGRLAGQARPDWPGKPGRDWTRCRWAPPHPQAPQAPERRVSGECACVSVLRRDEQKIQIQTSPTAPCCSSPLSSRPSAPIYPPRLLLAASASLRLLSSPLLSSPPPPSPNRYTTHVMPCALMIDGRFHD